jgi:hypothetical protein
VNEPSDVELWRCVETTVRDVLLPAIADDWARVVAVQLVGMARFARTRPGDQVPDRVAELSALLDGLTANPIVAAHWPAASTDPATVLAAVSSVLADAVGAADDDAAAEVRGVVRPVVVRHLDEDLSVTDMLMPYFRGKLPDA